MRRGVAGHDPRLLRTPRSARGAARRLRRHARRQLGRKSAARGALLRSRRARVSIRGRRAAQGRAAVHHLLAVLSLRRRRGLHQGRRGSQRSRRRTAGLRLGGVQPRLYRRLPHVLARSRLQAEQRSALDDEHPARAARGLVGLRYSSSFSRVWRWSSQTSRCRPLRRPSSTKFWSARGTAGSFGSRSESSRASRCRSRCSSSNSTRSCAYRRSSRSPTRAACSGT